MKIICIGRNYADHAKEMNSPVPIEPIFFMKPDTAIHRELNYYLPDFTKDLHHEIEIVVKINKVGKNEKAGKNLFQERFLNTNNFKIKISTN